MVKRRAAICGLLIILTLAAFAPVLRNDFTTYDDQTYVSANCHIQRGLSAETVCWAFTTTRAANWHPLTWLSHTLDWSLYGANPLGHHLTSLILHVINVVLLFLILDRATGAWRPAGLAAALFAVHPLHVESVAWIAERKDVPSALFWLIATIPGVAVVLALAALTRLQAAEWRDSVTGPNATVHISLGAGLEAQGRFADAMTHYDEALRFEPGNRVAHNRVAGLLARQGRLDEAVGHYLEVLRRNPADADTLSNLGIALAKQRKLDEAIARFKAALHAKPEDPAAILTNLGNALLLSGRTEEAVERYEESLRLNPGDADTLRNLNVARRKLGKPG